MPLIVVHNARNFENTHAVRLRELLRNACLEIGELGLEESDVTIEIQPASSSEAGPLIVLVELLFDKPERTFEVRQRLAQALGTVCQEFYHFYGENVGPVEVAVKRFDPAKDAFWKG